MPSNTKNEIKLHAVLYPLLGECQKRDRITKLMQLVDLRRQRVQQLHNAGWLPEVSERDISYILNCCPDMLVIGEKVRTCDKIAFCPFCYSRFIGDLYVKISTAIKSPSLIDCDLIYRVKTLFLPVDVDDISVPLNKLKSEWPGMMLDVAAKGGYFAITLAPSITDTGFDTYVRYIMVLRKNTRLPKWLAGVSRECAYNHDALSKIIAHVCEYPINLIYSPVSLLVLMLQKRARLRLVSTFGSFRNKTSRQQHD